MQGSKKRPIVKLAKDKFPTDVPTIGAVQSRDSAWCSKANPAARQAQLDFENKDKDIIVAKHEMKKIQYTALVSQYKIPQPQMKKEGRKI